MSEHDDRAVVLLSGGLDSATCLAMARDAGLECFCLSFAYGQRHGTEVEYSARIAQALGAREHRVASIDMGAFGGSALTDPSMEVPTTPDTGEEIPVTYVPARNTVFLSSALAWSEVLGARTIYIGVNAVDYSGYPDCRPEFIAAFETMANLATKAGVEGRHIRIETPLIGMSKAEIIRCGTALGVDYGMTVSCYQLSAAGEACGVCDSCRIRKEGFDAAGLKDPTRYDPGIELTER